MTEFEAREIDQHGDALDVTHWPTKAEAITAAKRLMADGAVAAVVEKHVKKYPMRFFVKPNEFTVIETMGNQEALREGGWID